MAAIQIQIILTIWWVGAATVVYFRLRSNDRRAAARDRALLAAIRETLGDDAVVIDLDLTDGGTTTARRWLRDVLSASVPSTPPSGTYPVSGRDDDTPPPPGQRRPRLPSIG